MAEAFSSQVVCPECRKAFSWKTYLANKELLCGCGAKLRMPATTRQAMQVVRPRDALAGTPDADGEIELNPDAHRKPLAVPSRAVNARYETPSPGEGIECPSCGKRLPEDAIVCVDCGIDPHTGRSFIIQQPGDVEVMYRHAKDAFAVLSWLLWIGLFPFATDARSDRRCGSLLAVAALTIVASVCFYGVEATHSRAMRTCKTLLLWSGMEPVNGGVILHAYSSRDGRTRGDFTAFENLLTQVLAERGVEATDPESDPEDEWNKAADAGERARRAMLQDAAVEAYRRLTPEQKVMGEFHGHQLFTHTLLHAGFWHLAGNLLFLFLFGAAINGLIGNVGFAMIYPLLGVAAGLIQHFAAGDDPRSAALGASGAIMGLAGMYLVFYPVHRVHVAAYARLGPLFGWRLLIKTFACRGYAILLFFIGQDVLSLALGVNNGTGHWAHLGGFLTGVAIAILLLMTRAVNAHGGDLLTVLLGPRAWALIGKPSQWVEKGSDRGWLQRIKLPARGREVRPS